MIQRAVHTHPTLSELIPTMLARTIHKLSAAAPESSGLTALRSFDLLDVLHEYACGGLGRDALSGRHFRRFVTTLYE